MATLTVPGSVSKTASLVAKALLRKRTSRTKIGIAKDRGKLLVADGNPSNTDTLSGMGATAMCYVPSTGRVYHTVNSGTTWTRIDG